jgi:hypothetical protein
MPESTRERNSDGQFTTKVSAAEILDAVADLEPAATADVGEAVGLARQNADYRLRQLEERGRVDRQKVGGSLVWSRADG